MKLIRLASLYLRPHPDEFTSVSMVFENCKMHILAVAKFPDALGLLIAAEKGIDSKPEIDQDGVVMVSEDHRKAAERAIEEFSHLLAIRDGSSWELKSPGIFLALEPETEEERKPLGHALSLIPMTASAALGGVKPKIDLDAEHLGAAIKDRFDGVALLSEALSHTHASAQLHEYVRLFERAFALSSAPLVTPLSDFLAGADQGYSETEVRNWLIAIRHPATHADRKTPIVLDADVLPVIFRIKQAAYDVLLNKAQWHTPSSERRNTWRAPAWTISPDSSNMNTVEGNTFRIETALLDRFRAFPLDLNWQIHDLLPKSWWFEPPSKANQETTGT